MYRLYEISDRRYEHREEVSLFGQNGYLRKLIEQHIKTNRIKIRYPLKLKIDVSNTLYQIYGGQFTLVIDLEPNSQVLAIYQVLDLWVYCYGNMSASQHPPLATVFMMALRGLFVDVPKSLLTNVNYPSSFHPPEHVEEPIFTYLYTPDGYIDSSGQIQGGWPPPPLSRTNSALIWPDAAEYFCQEMQKYLQRYKG